MSNYSTNKAELERFQRQIAELGADLVEAEVKVLNKSTNQGLKFAKKNSPVITGKLRQSWNVGSTVKLRNGAYKRLNNSMDYASYVNYGHRTVNNKGETTGYIKSKKGDHLLERTIKEIERRMPENFEKEIERIQKRHDR